MNSILNGVGELTKINAYLLQVGEEVGIQAEAYVYRSDLSQTKITFPQNIQLVKISKIVIEPKE